MFQFKIATDKINPLLHRLIGLVKGDDLASITFSLESDDFVEVYYKSKIDSGDLEVMFYEKLPILSHSGFGTASLHIKEIAGLKLTAFTKLDSFPHSKDVTFNFTNAVLKVNYDVIYGADIKPTEMKLAYALMKKEVDLEEFETLSTQGKQVVSLNTSLVKNSIQYCNFFRQDATSKQGNGCLLKIKEGKLSVLGTDSNMAALYESPINSDAEIAIVISDSVFKVVDKFISDTETIEISLKRSWLHVSTGSRKMLVPTLNTVSTMEMYIPLFTEQVDLISVLPAKPIVDAVSTLILRSMDSRNRVDVAFDLSKSSLDVVTAKNSTKNLPCEVYKDEKMSINGEYLITAFKRGMKSSPSLKLGYKQDSTRWTIFSDGEEKVTYLVQGLTI